MKKIIALLALCVASFACAQEVPSVGKSTPREHRGFYNSTSFALAYNWYDNSREDIEKKGDRRTREVDYYEFNGFSLSMTEFKFGVGLGNLAAFHLVFNFGFFAGTVDHHEEYLRSTCEDGNCVESLAEDYDLDDPTSNNGYSFRTYVGFGTTIYPVQSKTSPLNGFFFGGSVGYTLFVTMINGGHNDNSGNGGIGFQLEMGKDWWVNDHLSVGFGFGYAHNGLVWETTKSHKTDNVLSLSFRMTRG